MSAPAFLVAAPNIEIRDGIAFIDVEGRQICCMSIDTLRATQRSANRAVDRWAEAQTSKVVPMGRRQG